MRFSFEKAAKESTYYKNLDKRMFDKIKKYLLLILSFLFVSNPGLCGRVESPRIMLGVDVLQSMGFAPLKGKRVGLLTHPAGVNRWGKSTIEVLRGARGVKLVALFGPEHGIYGNEKANVPVLNKVDSKTGLPVYSLYGKYRKPTPEMLSKIDVLVIDLQDVGARSYTYISCMLRAMEACFENGKEVLVLDRPNPLGGIKVDGPMLDLEFKSYVGMFEIPYVHGLTIGELARWAKAKTGAMDISLKAQRAGKLTVIPMRGWKREMLWTDTGLGWVATSPAVPSVSAAFGYAMTGLGCQLGGFQHGYGTAYPFRMLTYPEKSPEQIREALKKFNIRGLSYRPVKTKDVKGREVRGLYVIVDSWNLVRPTELSFYMMKLACEFSKGNPFAAAGESEKLLFNKHTGSADWWREISLKGKNADVEKFVAEWNKKCAQFRKDSSKYFLY